MNIPTNILALIFVLSVLIVVHEFGTTRGEVLQVPVEVFSVASASALFGFKRKETDYRVSLIPSGAT